VRGGTSATITVEYPGPRKNGRKGY